MSAQLCPTIEAIGTIVHNNGWMTFNERLDVNANTLFAVHKKEFGLSDLDSMYFVRADTMSHIRRVRYQQYHNGIEVYGAVFIAVEYSGVLTRGHGKVVHNLKSLPKRIVPAQSALHYAISKAGIDKFAWEDANFNQWLSDDHGVPKSGHLPFVVLRYEPIDYNLPLTADNVQLVYNIQLIAANTWETTQVRIVAENGKLLDVIKMESGCTFATADTKFNGEQDIVVKLEGSDYILESDDCETTKMITRSITQHVNSDPLNEYNVDHGDLDWTDDSDLDPYVQGHWGTMMTFDFFAQTDYGYEGYDNNQSDMKLLIGGSAPPDWHRTLNLVHTPDPSYYTSLMDNWPTSVDLIAHE